MAFSRISTGLLASLFVAACSAAGAPDSAAGSGIVLGSEATGHPEAVLVDISKGGQVQGYCSGALVAPYVVLTAGHCVDGYDGWTVRAPFAMGVSAQSSTGLTLDYKGNGATANLAQHDVALLVLSSPITIPAYPSIARMSVAGASVVSIGRVRDGDVSATTLYEGMPVRAFDATPYGAPLDYISMDEIQEGDSGGPAELANSSPPMIVAVSSGSFPLMNGATVNGAYELLARTDLVASWIDTQIAAYPSGAPFVTPDAGAPDGGSPDAGALDAGPPPDAAPEAGPVDGGATRDAGFTDAADAAADAPAE